MIQRKEKQAIRATCRALIEELEGDGSYLIKAAEDGQNSVEALVDVAMRFLGGEMRAMDAYWERSGLPDNYDSNAFAAGHLAVYFATWFSWVSNAKSRDPRRPIWQRKSAKRAARHFLKQLRLAIQEGRKQVKPILRRRGEM